MGSDMSIDNLEKIEEFSSVILKKASIGNIEVIDAIISYCEELDLEIESIIPLLSQSLLNMIEEEAISLRLIKSSARKLLFE